MLEFSQVEYKIKLRKDLITEEYTYQWISYLQISERIKVAKRLYGFEQAKTTAETQLYRNDEHVIAKMCRLLLKFETEEKQVQESMLECAKHFGYSIQMEQWGKLWLKITEIFNK